MNARSDAADAIDVRGLNKHFGDKHVVDDLSLKVKRGEIFGFLGPNGSGKTTSIRLMCGLLTPDSGSGTCLGYDIRTQSGEIKRHVGYMTQRFSFWDDLSIRENLDFIARVYEMPARRDFWEELHGLAARGISVLVSTHYMDEAERCHKLAYIAYGKLMAQGTADEIIAAQHLTTWNVTGGDLVEITKRLHDVAGVDQVTPFGTSLHVTGRDATALEAGVRGAIEGTPSRAEPAPTTLEDVFIQRTGHRFWTEATDGSVKEKEGID